MKTLICFVGAITTLPLLAQKTFDTPDAAAQALIQAASNNDTAQLAEIFGPKGGSLLTSGNPEQDKAERQEFSSVARKKYQLEKDSMDNDRMILSIGTEDWPFPAPIVRKDGKWSFDSGMGQMSIQARRIGSNELDAIEVCAGYVGRQEEYAKQHSMHYASTIKGLANQVPKEFIEATGANPKPYHGYYFEVLKSQGSNAPGGPAHYMTSKDMTKGFGLIAWPAEYGVTGVHSFIVSRDGIVYEKDLGQPSNVKAAPIVVYDPDNTWVPVN
jgi:hypothetical protein